MESNREHHLNFYEDTYREYPERIAMDLFTLADIYKRFQNYEQRMKIIDQNRRENAFLLGVTLKESDARYNWESYLKTIPEIIKALLEQEKKYGIKFGDIRP